MDIAAELVILAQRARQGEAVAGYLAADDDDARAGGGQTFRSSSVAARATKRTGPILSLEPGDKVAVVPVQAVIL